jgi:hypothetical protein
MNIECVPTSYPQKLSSKCLTENSSLGSPQLESLELLQSLSELGLLEHILHISILQGTQVCTTLKNIRQQNIIPLPDSQLVKIKKQMKV